MKALSLAARPLLVADTKTNLVAPLPAGQAAAEVEAALVEYHTVHSDHEIAKQCFVSHPTVGKYRAQLEATNKIYKSDRRTGADGRTINTANIGKGGIYRCL